MRNYFTKILRDERKEEDGENVGRKNKERTIRFTIKRCNRDVSWDNRLTNWVGLRIYFHSGDYFGLKRSVCPFVDLLKPLMKRRSRPQNKRETKTRRGSKSVYSVFFWNWFRYKGLERPSALSGPLLNNLCVWNRTDLVLKILEPNL